MNTEQPNTIDPAFTTTSVGVRNSSGGALGCMKSEIIVSYVLHCGLLHPHIVNNSNSKIILQCCFKHSLYTITKMLGQVETTC